MTCYGFYRILFVIGGIVISKLEYVRTHTQYGYEWTLMGLLAIHLDKLDHDLKSRTHCTDA